MFDFSSLTLMRVFDEIERFIEGIHGSYLVLPPSGDGRISFPSILRSKSGS